MVDVTEIGNRIGEKEMRHVMGHRADREHGDELVLRREGEEVRVPRPTQLQLSGEHGTAFGTLGPQIGSAVVDAVIERAFPT